MKQSETSAALLATSSSSSSSLRSSIQSFLAGGVGGICAVGVGFPFDLIKVRMQTGVVAAGNKSGGVFGALGKTLRSEGIRGLYRGVTPPLVASTPIYAMSFWGYDVGQRVVRWYSNEHELARSELRPLTIPEIMVAGGLSALPVIVVMTPTERIKCLLQVQTQSTSGKSPQYTGMIDCATKVYKSGGLPSLYKGTMLTLMRDVPGSIAWFGTYEVLKRVFMDWQGHSSAGDELSPLAIMTAGGFAGMACWGASIVPDNLKSKYQVAPEGKYTGMADLYRTVVKEEGYGALWTGFRPAMIRAFPANAACFLGMEVGRKVLSFLD